MRWKQTLFTWSAMKGEQPEDETPPLDFGYVGASSSWQGWQMRGTGGDSVLIVEGFIDNAWRGDVGNSAPGDPPYERIVHDILYLNDQASDGTVTIDWILMDLGKLMQDIDLDGIGTTRAATTPTPTGGARTINRARSAIGFDSDTLNSIEPGNPFQMEVRRSGGTQTGGTWLLGGILYLDRTPIS